MGASRSQAMVIPVGNGIAPTSAVYGNSAVVQPIPTMTNLIVPTPRMTPVGPPVVMAQPPIVAPYPQPSCCDCCYIFWCGRDGCSVPSCNFFDCCDVRERGKGCSPACCGPYGCDCGPTCMPQDFCCNLLFCCTCCCQGPGGCCCSNNNVQSIPVLGNQFTLSPVPVASVMIPAAPAQAILQPALMSPPMTPVSPFYIR